MTAAWQSYQFAARRGTAVAVSLRGAPCNLLCPYTLYFTVRK